MINVSSNEALVKTMHLLHHDKAGAAEIYFAIAHYSNFSRPYKKSLHINGINQRFDTMLEVLTKPGYLSITS